MGLKPLKLIKRFKWRLRQTLLKRQEKITLTACPQLFALQSENIRICGEK